MTAAERISLFFPERSQTDIARAKAVCQTCSVRTECLDEAIENRERFGVWGGMDTQERQKEARRRRIAAHQVLVSSCETPEGDGD